MLALLPHSGKEAAMRLGRELIPRLERCGLRVWLDPEVAGALGRLDLSGSSEDLSEARLALVLGGDGALLKAARLVAPYGVPILGVNLGHLGFLTAVEPAGMEEVLERVLDHKYEIEERLMLRATVVRKDARVASFFGLNDAVITRGVFARVIEFDSYVDSALVGTFLADGIIISTPTGSTAYSLSAGGPIVNPGVEALVVTPICPHTIGARTLVTRPDERVKVRLTEKTVDAMLTVDGQIGESLEPFDEVVVERAGKPARLVKLEGPNFYTLLHNRFLQGNTVKTKQ